jgi:hypothetical protein
VSACVYFLNYWPSHSEPPTFVFCQVATERNVSLLFSEVQDNDHCGGCLKLKIKERLHIFCEICFYIEALPKTFYLDRSSILLLMLSTSYEVDSKGF